MSDNERRETHADIIAEMRRGTKLPGYWRSCDVNEILQYHADRAEAAHRRDLAALRDAVVAARRVLAVWGDELPFRAWNEKGEALDKCDAALREGGSNV